jgi:hypothetical protein
MSSITGMATCMPATIRQETCGQRQICHSRGLTCGDIIRCVIVELRQYTLKPGARDTLVDLFERHFVTGQEAVGINVIGQFRDLDDPDRFVWLRSFPDMAARTAALTAFYFQSEEWRTYGPAANATMIDSSDVLLLRPVGPMFAERTAVRYTDRYPGRYTVMISPDPLDATDALAYFETEHAENDFPRLPVRTGQFYVAFRAGDGAGLRLEPTPRSALR